MNIVIINKNQPLMNFPAAFPGENRITVSIDGPIQEFPIIPGVHFTALGRHPEGFYAGANRNNGLRESYAKYGKSGHVLFLDGDRVPTPYDKNIILHTLSRYNADVLLFVVCDDSRAIAKSGKPDGLVDAGCLVSEFYSCGLVLTDSAIDRVCALNAGHLFHPAFNGHWGEEDKYLGIQLSALGLKTCFTNRIRLGGGPLGGIVGRPDYAISLQTRINLMLTNGYPIRHTDKYAHLEKDAHGRIIKIYDGMPPP